MSDFEQDNNGEKKIPMLINIKFYKFLFKEIWSSSTTILEIHHIMKPIHKFQPNSFNSRNTKLWHPQFHIYIQKIEQIWTYFDTIGDKFY